jgi:hypothetical protein
MKKKGIAWVSKQKLTTKLLLLNSILLALIFLMSVALTSRKTTIVFDPKLPVTIGEKSYNVTMPEFMATVIQGQKLILEKLN